MESSPCSDCNWHLQGGDKNAPCCKQCWEKRKAYCDSQDPERLQRFSGSRWSEGYCYGIVKRDKIVPEAETQLTQEIRQYAQQWCDSHGLDFEVICNTRLKRDKMLVAYRWRLVHELRAQWPKAYQRIIGAALNISAPTISYMLNGDHRKSTDF